VGHGATHRGGVRCYASAPSWERCDPQRYILEIPLPLPSQVGGYARWLGPHYPKEGRLLVPSNIDSGLFVNWVVPVDLGVSFVGFLEAEKNCRRMYGDDLLQGWAGDVPTQEEFVIAARFRWGS